jgi:hypothetical protein
MKNCGLGDEGDLWHKSLPTGEPGHHLVHIRGVGQPVSQHIVPLGPESRLKQTCCLQPRSTKYGQPQLNRTLEPWLSALTSASAFIKTTHVVQRMCHTLQNSTEALPSVKAFNEATHSASIHSIRCEVAQIDSDDFSQLARNCSALIDHKTRTSDYYVCLHGQ